MPGPGFTVYYAWTSVSIAQYLVIPPSLRHVEFIHIRGVTGTLISQAIADVLSVIKGPLSLTLDRDTSESHTMLSETVTSPNITALYYYDLPRRTSSQYQLRSNPVARPLWHLPALTHLSFTAPLHNTSDPLLQKYGKQLLSLTFVIMDLQGQECLGVFPKLEEMPNLKELTIWAEASIIPVGVDAPEAQFTHP